MRKIYSNDEVTNSDNGEALLNRAYNVKENKCVDLATLNNVNSFLAIVIYILPTIKSCYVSL